MTDSAASQENRHGKGTIEWVGRGDRGCWYARVSIPGEARQRVKLFTPPPECRPLTDRERDRALAIDLAAELSEVMRSESYQREAMRLASRTTVKAFGELWTSGELLKRYGEVRGLKAKRSVDDDAYRLRAHVYPYLGPKAVAEVTEQDIERAVARAAAKAEQKLRRPWRQATKFQLYQVLKRLFDLAEKPGRLRPKGSNPVSIDLRPTRDSQKLYSFLYPAELLAVLGCTKVPLARRVYYALAVYTGLRKGSLSALTWGSVDFENCMITSLESKTGLPQIFTQADPALPGLQSLLVVLKRWHEQCGCPGTSVPLVGDLGCRDGREAEALRADLKAASVTRDLLFSRSPQVEPLRFHDMRATFCTWARRAGMGRGWVSDRTGHQTEAMMQRYERAARSIVDLRYQPFPDLSSAIPELSNDLSNVARLRDFRHGERA